MMTETFGKPDFCVISVDGSARAYTITGALLDLPEAVVQAWIAGGVQTLRLHAEPAQVESARALTQREAARQEEARLEALRIQERAQDWLALQRLCAKHGPAGAPPDGDPVEGVQAMLADARRWQKVPPEVVALLALYDVEDVPTWTCEACGGVYLRDIITGCPTCSKVARTLLDPNRTV